MRRDLSQPISIGIVTALVGFTSSFAVVLAGLRGVGADTAEASSGLAILCLLQGLGMARLAWRHRTPLTLAWSTPGVALLATQGYVKGGWPAAIGAFLVTGALIVMTGLWKRLGDLIAAIPTPIAQAMLAGQRGRRGLRWPPVAAASGRSRWGWGRDGCWDGAPPEVVAFNCCFWDC
jgi:benzoate membrane transport protein